jgi:phosphomannomutase
VIDKSEVEAWIKFDPDEASRNTLQSWLDSNNQVELEKSFQGLLEFGTAGLRGPVRPGPSGMNRAVVAKAACGIIAYAKKRGMKKIIIGRDARYGSESFTQESAELFAGAGFEVYLLPKPLPTPILAFAVNELGMDIGVMVTASHNPGGDNGYKVYLGGEADGINYRGSQIISPTDSFIAKEIEQVQEIGPRGSEWTILDMSVVDKYIEKTSELAKGSDELKIVYTAMHGVGKEVFLELFNKSGFTNIELVSEQVEPDPDFPTVAFPNPEEAGAMDLALAKAVQVNADIVLANDPDADRSAMAIKEVDGSYRTLRGDEVGILLGYFIAQRGLYPLTGKSFANSIVSSSALSKIANKYGVEFQETLTGFKYLAKITNLAFGYEEALGYAVDPVNVNDKDGISAALLLARIALTLKQEGKSISIYLDEIWNAIGYHRTSSVSVRFSDLKEIPAAMDRLRNQTPTSLAGYPVTKVEDLAKPTSNLPATNGLRFFLEVDSNPMGIRAIFRPSGTEPKLKIYLELIGKDAYQKTKIDELAIELASELPKAVKK